MDNNIDYNAIDIEAIQKRMFKNIKVDGIYGGYKFMDLSKLLGILSEYGLLAQVSIDMVDGSISTHTRIYNTKYNCSNPLLENKLNIRLDTNFKDIHKVGSAITYLRRYSILTAMGLHPDNEDSDGIDTFPSNAFTDSTKKIKDKETKRRESIDNISYEDVDTFPLNRRR